MTSAWRWGERKVSAVNELEATGRRFDRFKFFVQCHCEIHALLLQMSKEKLVVL